MTLSIRTVIIRDDYAIAQGEHTTAMSAPTVVDNPAVV